MVGEDVLRHGRPVRHVRRDGQGRSALPRDNVAKYVQGPRLLQLLPGNINEELLDRNAVVRLEATRLSFELHAQHAVDIVSGVCAPSLTAMMKRFQKARRFGESPHGVERFHLSHHVKERLATRKNGMRPAASILCVLSNIDDALFQPLTVDNGRSTEKGSLSGEDELLYCPHSREPRRREEPEEIVSQIGR